MKIIYLQPAEAFGGAERQGVLHMRHLPEHGISVVPVVGPGRAILRELEAVGVTDYTYFPYFPDVTHSNLSPAGNARYFAHWMRAIRRSTEELVKLARREAPDLIFASRTTSWLIAPPAAQALGIPWVARAGSRPFNPLALAGLPVMQLIWPAPAALLVNCDAVRKEIGRFFRCPVLDLLNAVDTDRFDPARFGVTAHDGLVVGMAARPAPEKGIDFLLEVVKRVTERMPGVTFLLAGEFGWRPEYEARAQRAGLGESLRFLGHVEDVAAFYAGCDVVVLTSRRRSIEASPNTLLEAMAMERPIVATAVGGIPEMIRSGLEGLLAEDEDVAGFADAVITLLGDPALRRRLGDAGRRRVLARHAVEPITAGLAATLRAILEQTAADQPSAASSGAV